MLFVRGQIKCLSKTERLRISEIAARIANAISGEIRHRRKQHIVAGEKRVFRVTLVFETNELGFKGITQLLQVAAAENFTHITGVGFVAGQRIKGVETPNIVFVGIRIRLHQDDSRIIRLVGQDVMLVGVAAVARMVSVRCHAVKFRHGRNRIARLNLNDGRPHRANQIFHSGLMPALVDLAAVFVEKGRILLVALGNVAGIVERHLLHSS